LVLLTKRLVAAAKFLVVATKSLFVVPYLVAVTKPFFLCSLCSLGNGRTETESKCDFEIDVQKEAKEPLKSA